MAEQFKNLSSPLKRRNTELGIRVAHQGNYENIPERRHADQSQVSMLRVVLPHDRGWLSSRRIDPKWCRSDKKTNDVFEIPRGDSGG